jgi:hypothetical protein
MLRFLVCFLTLATFASAQQNNGDFGTKFFADLRMLFGRLQQSELDRAFQRANAAHCSDLVGQSGDWKEVAFLNDDRKLGDWHFDNIEDVKRDPTKFVFSGLCRGDRGPVQVTTSYPIGESLKTRSIRMRDNDPVSVIFDPPSDSYIFQLPYLYLEGRDSQGSLYTLVPPGAMSRPEKDVAEEFRCKALNDPELTYRFLLCRTRVVDRDAQMQRLNKSQQPLGNAAYYILSDGKEATSSVKLTFGPEVETKPEKNEASATPDRTAPPPRPTIPELQQSEKGWQAPASQTRLVDVGEGEFRIHFNPQSWNGRIRSAQLLAGKTMTESARPPAARTQEYCAWRPVASPEVEKLLKPAVDNVFLYSLSFKKEVVAISASFDIDNEEGTRLGTLQCYFPQSSTPADITVARWTAIVGPAVTLDIRAQ